MYFQDNDARDLLERVCAAAIANQAILKCMFARQPPTIDNVVGYVGDFFDPANENFAGITRRIEGEIAAVIESSRPLRTDPPPANEN